MKTFSRSLSAAVLAVLAAALAVPVEAQLLPTWQQPNFKNLLHNPRMDLYPASTSDVYTSSTISATLTGLNTTPTYYAGRWATWANAGGASVTVANVTSSLPGGFANAVKLNRGSANASTQQICMGQEMRTADVLALQGSTLGLSVWASAGSTFSASGGNMTFLVGTGTGTDEGLTTFLSGFAGAATPLSATTAITTTMTRYGAVFTMPATATEAVVAFCWTPVGTASGTTDSLTLTGAQLEQGGNVTAFEARPQVIENLLNVLPYTQVLTDGATTRRYASACTVTTANTTVVCDVTLQTPMWKAPTTTIGTATSFGIILTAGTAGTCTTLAATATSNTVASASVTCTTGGTIALGSASNLIGANTGGLLMFSSDF